MGGNAVEMVLPNCRQHLKHAPQNMVGPVLSPPAGARWHAGVAHEHGSAQPRTGQCSPLHLQSLVPMRQPAGGAGGAQSSRCVLPEAGQWRMRGTQGLPTAAARASAN